MKQKEKISSFKQVSSTKGARSSVPATAKNASQTRGRTGGKTTGHSSIRKSTTSKAGKKG